MIHLALSLLLTPSAEAAPRGEVSAGASVDPASVPVGTAARFVGEMCDDGTTSVGGTAFLGTYIPTSAGYRVVSSPTSVACRAVRYGTYNYVFCTVSLRPGMCQEVQMDVTPGVAGDLTLYVLADSANVLREANELDNRASVVLTAY